MNDNETTIIQSANDVDLRNDRQFLGFQQLGEPIW